MEALTGREIVRRVVLQTVGVMLVCVGIHLLPFGSHCPQYSFSCLDPIGLEKLSAAFIGIGLIFVSTSVWSRSH